MNPTIELIHRRKSIRDYEDRPVPDSVRDEILRAALRAPTAGNMMLYSIIHVSDPAAKATLARTCDNQPFIAKAPLVLLFLADYQRWYDYFRLSGAEELSAGRGRPMQTPEEGDLLLACCDALIAAQTAVLAAESLGLGSCYIGDILENCEEHRRLFGLPRYAFPVSLLCFGYPTQEQRQRPLTSRFDRDYIVFENRYRSLQPHEFEKMFHQAQQEMDASGTRNPGLPMYQRRFTAEFSREMRRSVKRMLESWAPD